MPQDSDHGQEVSRAGEVLDTDGHYTGIIERVLEDSLLLILVDDSRFVPVCDTAVRPSDVSLRVSWLDHVSSSARPSLPGRAPYRDGNRLSPNPRTGRRYLPGPLSPSSPYL